MRADFLPIEQLRLVPPRAMKSYAVGIGWKPVEGDHGSIALFHDPKSALKQLMVPLDQTYDDYTESVSKVIDSLAEFEQREPRKILDHLLLPPADLLSFREVSPEAEAGDISVEHGCRLIEGVQKALLATAHSVEHPKPFHPRLSREEAKQFLSRCRMNTARGSFILNIACVLDQPVALPGMEEEPFTRRVTSLFAETLQALELATRTDGASKLLDAATNQGLSANFCEALLSLRPAGERAKTVVTTEWSRALLPTSKNRTVKLELHQDVFDLAERLAPKLRSTPEPETITFFGFVDSLHGSPVPPDRRPSGEVRVTLMEQDEEIHARLELNVEDYAKAGRAHLDRKPIMLSGNLHRLPRLNRVENVTEFDFVPIHRR
jgi:hypothetical protein